jgi:hypothetical protein
LFLETNDNFTENGKSSNAADMTSSLPLDLIKTKKMQTIKQTLPIFLKPFSTTTNKFVKSNIFIEKNTKIDSIFGYLTETNQNNQLEVII